MNEDSPVFDLTVHLAMLSFMAIGGGLVMIAPEIHQYVVNNKHWLQNEQFAAAYAIAQAAPGPNLLFISLAGWFIAGWTGAICATLAVILPSTGLTLAILRVKSKQPEGRLSRVLRDTFAPISVGLLCATAWLFTQVSNVNWHADVLTALSAFIVLRTKFNPVVLIFAGAAAGVAHLI